MIDNPRFGLGVVSFALNGQFDNPEPNTLVEKVNGLEIPGERRFIELLAMPTTQPGNIEKIAKVIKDANYGITICGFRPGEKTPDMMSADMDEVNRALADVYVIMDCAKAAGATRVGGPWIRNHGNLTVGDGRYLEYALGEVAKRAEEMKIYMCMEMLNAFEMRGFNNLDTTLPIIEKVGSNYVLVHMDPAHSLREERSITDAAERLYTSGKFGHAHISELGRGPIGSGILGGEKLAPFLGTLARLGYGRKGEVAIVEVFHPSMYDAVKRVDTVGIAQKSPAEQDAFALNEAKQSFQVVRTAYQAVCDSMNMR